MLLQVGFNAGDGVHFFSVEGSMSMDILNIASQSNMNIPGRWIFRLDSHTIQDGGCNNYGGYSNLVENTIYTSTFIFTGLYHN